jgi:hypothetical protein
MTRSHTVSPPPKPLEHEKLGGAQIACDSLRNNTPWGGDIPQRRLGKVTGGLRTLQPPPPPQKHGNAQSTFRRRPPEPPHPPTPNFGIVSLHMKRTCPASHDAGRARQREKCACAVAQAPPFAGLRYFQNTVFDATSTNPDLRQITSMLQLWHGSCRQFLRKRVAQSRAQITAGHHLGAPKIPTWTRNGWWWLLPYQSPTLGRLARHPPPPWPPFPYDPFKAQARRTPPHSKAPHTKGVDRKAQAVSV